MFTSSLGGGLDPYAVKPVIIKGERKYEQKHIKDHLDCLVATNTAKPLSFIRDSLTLINKIRPLTIASFPGLNTSKLLGKRWALYPEPHLIDLRQASTTPFQEENSKGKRFPMLSNRLKIPK